MSVRVLVTDHVGADLEIERSLLAAVGAEVELAPAADEATLSDLVRGRQLDWYASAPRALDASRPV